MENENKQPLVQVKDLCKYFQINRHATYVNILKSAVKKP